MKLSSFGKRFSTGSGILSLMDDLGNALAGGDMIMMGGGNPGHVPEVQEMLRRRLRELAEDPAEFRKLIGIYDPPRGEKDFLQALAALLRSEYGWDLGPENICLTNGSQGSFFLLFNMFAGRFDDGSHKKVLLPLAPEYIGYADLGLSDDFFTAVRPRIDFLEDNLFKYRVDFDHIEVNTDIGVICASRPTNPTGNVLTDDEIQGLARLAAENDIPFIIDNAYGVPFPGIIYTEATPVWNENLIVCMSLSKFGLPAARTGIVIARTEIIEVLSGINSILNLAPGSFGAMLTTDIVRSGEIIRLSREVIMPFYRRKMEKAMHWINTYFTGFDYRVHTPEGAMFLWLWFPELPISSRTLYERLKERGVLVVSGDYFFPGLEPGWSHTGECIRITYSQDEEDVHQGLRIIGEEVRRACGDSG
ncbi:valine--pyruvate transaminase [Desulfolithobacter dissulfuricans]|uniref:Valine--pyruvate transaminase n=1 Tax=Desulfolithobacter dissulfuricans TaxID=2795293 RepID=A0A915U9K2_9BACT|nr:valine--pyruvate transaminase [Desulfolithobacter dissulfuricans]BCO08465.1 valine--pyruvate transaminase [Desulfolithobacter dissulfuricans]